MITLMFNFLKFTCCFIVLWSSALHAENVTRVPVDGSKDKVTLSNGVSFILPNDLKSGTLISGTIENLGRKTLEGFTGVDSGSPMYFSAELRFGLMPIVEFQLVPMAEMRLSNSQIALAEKSAVKELFNSLETNRKAAAKQLNQELMLFNPSRKNLEGREYIYIQEMIREDQRQFDHGIYATTAHRFLYYDGRNSFSLSLSGLSSMQTVLEKTAFEIVASLEFPWSPRSAEDEFQRGLKLYKTKERTAAMALFESLAIAGMQKAQFKLALIHEGDGNLPEAMKWYRLSAIQGNSSSALTISRAYQNGTGVTQDNVKALSWAAIFVALVKSEFAVKHAQEIGDQMTEGEKKEAAEILKDCSEKKFLNCEL